MALLGGGATSCTAQSLVLQAPDSIELSEGSSSVSITAPCEDNGYQLLDKDAPSTHNSSRKPEHLVGPMMSTKIGTTGPGSNPMSSRAPGRGPRAAEGMADTVVSRRPLHAALLSGVAQLMPGGRPPAPQPSAVGQEDAAGAFGGSAVGTPPCPASSRPARGASAAVLLPGAGLQQAAAAYAATDHIRQIPCAPPPTPRMQKAKSMVTPLPR